MPRQKAPSKKLVTAWSNSALNQLEECPARFYYARVLKLPEGLRGAALVRGSEIHKEGEIYLKTKKGDVPNSFELFTEEMEDLRARGAASEAQWAFREDWTECEWFADDVWLRVMLDTYYTDTMQTVRGKNVPGARVIDFKTGKVREGYGDQLELYALASFKKFPDVQVVVPELWFLDEGEIVGGPQATIQMEDVKPLYERGRDEKRLQDKWEKRGRKVIEFAKEAMAPDFEPEPTPSWVCKFCPYSQKSSKMSSPPCPH